MPRTDYDRVWDGATGALLSSTPRTLTDRDLYLQEAQAQRQKLPWARLTPEDVDKLVDGAGALEELRSIVKALAREVILLRDTTNPAP